MTYTLRVESNRVWLIPGCQSWSVAWRR